MIPSAGFDPLLTARMEAVLRPCAAQGIRIITNMGAANPLAAAKAASRRSRDARASAASRSPRSPGTTCSTWSRQGTTRSRSGRAPSLRSDDSIRLGERLSRRRADRRGAARRRGRRHHRPRRRSGAVPRAARPRVRLGAWTTGTGSARHGRRPSAGMRRPDHRRLLRRSRLQGRPRSGPARLSDRRGRRGWLGGDHQGRRLGRTGQRRDLQGAAAVRDCSTRQRICSPT